MTTAGRPLRVLVVDDEAATDESPIPMPFRLPDLRFRLDGPVAAASQYVIPRLSHSFNPLARRNARLTVRTWPPEAITSGQQEKCA